MKWIRNALRIVLKGLKWLLFIILAVLLISGLYNTTLPDASSVTERLTDDQKVYIAEYFHLQEEIVSNMWSDYDSLIPAIVYNEEYAFLVGLEDPAPGWVKMPNGEERGAEWEPVAGDQFYGTTYYRQPLPNPDITPENFTVTVGDHWVSTMQTREFAEISFFNGFKEELPPFINLVFPYELFWNLIMGDAENYVTGLIHEGFHAYQAVNAYDRFAASETVTRLHSEYPWQNSENRRGWEMEATFLMKAWEAEEVDERTDFAKKFLDAREQRRENAGLEERFITYETQREWLEGLAKYTELKTGVIAAQSNSYKPVDGAAEATDFNMYQNKESYLKSQIAEVNRAIGRQGDSRFYYGGMLQAMILDQLDPDWRDVVLEEDVYLEDLLRQAVGNKQTIALQ